MLFHFTKNQRKADTAEALFWRCYISIYLVSVIVLLPFVGVIEALFFAWVLTDGIGGALVMLSALSFIFNALSARLRMKFGQKF